MLEPKSRWKTLTEGAWALPDGVGLLPAVVRVTGIKEPLRLVRLKPMATTVSGAGATGYARIRNQRFKLAI